MNGNPYMDNIVHLHLHLLSFASLFSLIYNLEPFFLLYILLPVLSDASIWNLL